MKTANFRVFDPVTKEMYYVGEDDVSIVFGSAGWRLYVEDNPVTTEDEGELMMFTGLHDCDETPIHEGDIIVFPDQLSSGARTDVNVVQYSDNSDWVAGIWLVNKFHKRCRVIGNTHQHPDKLFEEA